MEKTLGGDRLGSGNKQKVELHNYEMNSFNLEQDFKSSMAPGILYPFIKMVATNHGTFDIDLDSFVRTLPTKGPLFGSFKLQLDLFMVPFRLYQGILHNNPVGIGLKMNQVYLPKLDIATIDGKNAPKVQGSTFYNRQVNENALIKYLGLSGIGTSETYQMDEINIHRKINAVPALAYYDIFKCYYSNKQEENAYVITPGNENTVTQPDKIKFYRKENGKWKQVSFLTIRKNEEYEFRVTSENATDISNQIHLDFTYLREQYQDELLLDFALDYGTITKREANELIWTMSAENTETLFDEQGGDNTLTQTSISRIEDNDEGIVTADIILQPFPLENIDKMRNRLLSANELGYEFIIDENEEDLPYKALTARTSATNITWNAFQLNGLVVKTYQSDLFNNWLNTDWVDEISNLTKVNTSEGGFFIDSLNFAEKYYEVLNRIAIGGGTYEDWQESVYGEGAVRKAETPMYMGGMSAEIMFEEVISTAETEIRDDFQALGSLGGKGTQVGRNGGKNIHVKFDEPGYLMGIVSLTPRICYSQGNDWDLTELDSLDDLHKPGLDGIGFQDLIVEQMAWWDTKIMEGTAGIERNSAGKQTAWINYQTAVDKCYGDFAKQDGYSFMVLNRNYEVEDDGENIPTVKDITTYIDPAKYNYAFADTDLASQNFWVQIHSKVIARRKMGAQQIPNL